MLNSGTHDPQFTVEFSTSVAWTLVYADSAGQIEFCFEPGETKKRVYLNTRSSLEGKMPLEDFYRTERYKLALERTKQYLVSCGYEVLFDN